MIYNLKTKAGKQVAQREKLFIKFKETILKKIVPLTSPNTKKKIELTQQLQKHFPDSLFI